MDDDQIRQIAREEAIAVHNEIADDIANDFKIAIIAAPIMMVVFIGLYLLIGWLSPDLLDKIIETVKWI